MPYTKGGGLLLRLLSVKKLQIQIKNDQGDDEAAQGTPESVNLSIGVLHHRIKPYRQGKQVGVVMLQVLHIEQPFP